MDILRVIDIIGVVVFAISGALTARSERLDFFGIATVSFVTALGGGTIRDVLIGSTPVGWMKDLTYLGLIIIGIFISIFFRKRVQKLRKTFFLFDTIGIAVFTVLGLQKALGIGIHPIIATMMGMVSAVFGGVTRDIICNKVPLIFRKEIYALPCLCGALIYVLLRYLEVPRDLNILISVIFIASFRALAVRFHWQLPSPYGKDEPLN